MDIKKLISEMSIDEKIGQLIQLNSNLLDISDSAEITGPQAKLNLTPEALRSCGSVLNFQNAETVIKIQSEHLKVDPHKIPMMFMMDVIHGYKTIYPIPLAMGCSFDPELVEECAEMSCKEAAVGGVQVNFSPMVDLARDARWGRVMETTSEDPYLNGVFAKAFVKGYQGDMDKEYNMPACVKHFAAYGAAEAGRDYNTVDMSEHNLREYYLPSYKAAIDAGAKMVMPSFNLINGVPSIGNKWLLQDILRKEWGFDGVVISDYAAIKEMITHGFAENEKAAAKLAIDAGCDIEMMSGAYTGYLKELVEEGAISMQQIDDAVYRVLKLKEEIGLFDNPYLCADPEKEKELCLCKEHREIAKKAAIESTVLLKNDGVLPVSKNVTSIAVIGPFSNMGGIKGFWSCHGEDSDTVTIYEGIKAKYTDSQIFTADGCGYALDEEDDSGFEQAIEYAKNAEAVILCIGEYEKFTGEGNSRSDITIPEIQMRLARKVLEVNKNTAILLFTGRPLAIPELNDIAPAILNMWQPGTEGGSAAAELISGDAVPAGKITMSFPYTVGQCPIYYNNNRTGRPLKKPYKEAKYCSRYQDCPNEPLFPFGHGLSYSEFEYGELTLDSDTMTADSKITASVTVKNVGKYTAKETVQLYIHDCFASLVRPVKELKGFEKITLKPGETKIVNFVIDEPMLRFWNFDTKYCSEPGDFEVMVGTNSKDVQTKTFRLI